MHEAWQQEQRVSAPLYKKGKTQNRSAQTRCSRCRGFARLSVCWSQKPTRVAAGFGVGQRWGRSPRAEAARSAKKTKRKNDRQARQTPGRKKPAEGEQRQDTVPFLSCPEAQKLRFQGARTTPLRSVVAPTGWTVLRVALGHRVRQSRAGVCFPGAWWRLLCPPREGGGRGSRLRSGGSRKHGAGRRKSGPKVHLRPENHQADSTSQSYQR
jgi:hypothetical protein